MFQMSTAVCIFLFPFIPYFPPHPFPLSSSLLLSAANSALSLSTTNIPEKFGEWFEAIADKSSLAFMSLSNTNVSFFVSFAMVVSFPIQ